MLSSRLIAGLWGTSGWHDEEEGKEKNKEEEEEEEEEVGGPGTHIIAYL